MDKDWQPIETAPKNREILAWVHTAAGGRVTTIEWGLSEWQWVESYDLTGWGHPYGPTHWMPLPDPPALAAAAREGGDVEQAPGETPQSGPTGNAQNKSGDSL